MFVLDKIAKYFTFVVIPILIIMMGIPIVGEAHDNDDKDDKDERSKNVRSYKVAQGDPRFPNPFPPWDVGPLPGGFSADILNAVCDANRKMECEIIPRPYNDCLFTDFDQPTNVGIGPALLDEEIVGCLTWARTNPRISRGISTTNPYSRASAPGVNTAVILSANGSINVGNSLVFFNGDATDILCANSAGYAYTTGDPTEEGAISKVDADTDAIVSVNGLPNSLPPGVFIATTFETDGITPLRCANGIRVATYPPANLVDTQSFISDFNCGLSLIAQNGTYQEICALYAPDSSVAPFCFASSEITKPTKACKKLRKRRRH